MGLLVGDSSGTVPGLDTDLGDSDASFIGEDEYDRSGQSVAGAGDVNGDGYDDILISARKSLHGGPGGGQTYLILGKAKGWSMDTDLSKADASFWGETTYDRSGDSVAGAGDVNGDGFDDILIGAPANGEGARLSGQTYLILGKRSGWSMDTNLSKADASFWGEGEYDITGYSVAGAGDVNGDGYDDILIGAPDAEYEGHSGGKTYLIFGNSSGWSMDTNLSNADASFLGEYADDRSGHSVAGAGDVNDDGYDDILIGAPWNDEGGRSSGQTYLILGKRSGWSRDTNLSDADASFWSGNRTTWAGDAVAGVGDVNGDEYDDILIGTPFQGRAFLIFGKKSGWLMDTNLSNSDASFVGGIDSVAGAGNVNGDGYDDILIGNNWAGAYLIFGKKSGWSQDAIPSNMDATFHCKSTSYRTYTVAGAGDVNGNGYDDILIGTPDYDDGSTGGTGQTYLIFYDDIAHPNIGEDMTQTTATTGDAFTFLLSAKPDINLSSVNVEYWYGELGDHKNILMTRGSGNLWNHYIIVPSDSLDTLHYFFCAKNNSNIFAPTWTKDVDVFDNDQPVIREDITPGEGTTGDPFIFSIEAEDNIGVAGLSVEYWYGDGTPMDLDLHRSVGLLWEGSISVVDTLDEINYQVIATDTSGNENSTPVRTVVVIDNDDPELVTHAIPMSATTGDPLELNVIVTDNIGIASVTVVYAFGDGAPTSTALDVGTSYGNGNIAYSLEIDVPSDSLATLVYHFIIEDVSGNVLTGSEFEVMIIDNDAPTVDYVTTVSEALKGLPLTLTIEATDNIGVEGAFAIVRYGRGSTENLLMEPGAIYSIDLDVPRHPDGDLVFHFSAVDGAGNWFSTGERTISLVNAAPEVADLPQWSLIEESESTYDLEPYLIDQNDDVGSLIVECGDGTVTVEGLVLRALYSEVKSDWTVTLTVSDGENDTSVELALHISNVNDAPEILSLSPANGTEYREGKVITFVVETSDEDGDDVTVTWSSDGVTMGTGETLAYKKLKPGIRVVKVTVADGETTVEEEFTVIIKKEEESPGFGTVTSAIALVLAALVLIMTRKRR